MGPSQLSLGLVNSRCRLGFARRCCCRRFRDLLRWGLLGVLDIFGGNFHLSNDILKPFDLASQIGLLPGKLERLWLQAKYLRPVVTDGNCPVVSQSFIFRFHSNIQAWSLLTVFAHDLCLILSLRNFFNFSEAKNKVYEFKSSISICEISVQSRNQFNQSIVTSDHTCIVADWALQFRMLLVLAGDLNSHYDRERLAEG